MERRVLLMPASYPPVIGGLQRMTHDLSRGLLRRGFEVCVATQRYPRHLAKSEVIDGVPVERFSLCNAVC